MTTYLALYYAARNTALETYRPWDWYLMRAANTTIKFGAPSVHRCDHMISASSLCDFNVMTV